MTTPEWPFWALVSNKGWTAFSMPEWDKTWSYAREQYEKTGRRTAQRVTEPTPWGALRWEWHDGPSGWNIYCTPIVATSVEEARRVVDLVSAMLPMKAWGAMAGAGMPTAALFQFVGMHWWEAIPAAALGIAGWVGGRKYDAHSQDALSCRMELDDLPIVMEPLRAIKTLQKPRWLHDALQKFYGQLVVDFWGPQDHNDDAQDVAEALHQVERAVTALQGLERLNVLTKHREQIEPLLTQSVPTVHTCTIIADELEALREAVTRAVAAQQAKQTAAALPSPASRSQERALNQAHAREVTQAAATGVESLIRDYENEAASQHAGVERLELLDRTESLGDHPTTSP